MRIGTVSRHWIMPIALGYAALACTEPPKPPPNVPTPVVVPPPAEPPLEFQYDATEFASNPELLERLKETPFGYFRYVDGQFTKLVCTKWGSATDQPTVNLHGDAHVEQYAVADDGRGLADFDTASLGPPIVDLLRFATSLWLTAHGRFSDAEADAAVTRFLDGYRAALADPTTTGPEPQVAARIRTKFDKGTLTWLDHVEKFMRPMTDPERERLMRSSTTYVDAILEQNPELQAGFFSIKHAGALKMGIGSAHEKKFLARVEGPTTAPDDDVILETKQVVEHPLGSCVYAGQWGPALRIMIGQSRLSGSPQKFLGHVDIEGKKFYVHAWRVHYTELSTRDIQSGAELAELAYDVGLQLGRGHPKHIDDAHDADLREKLRLYATKNDASIHTNAHALADETVKAWETFRRACIAAPRTTETTP